MCSPWSIFFYFNASYLEIHITFFQKNFFWSPYLVVRVLKWYQNSAPPRFAGPKTPIFGPFSRVLRGVFSTHNSILRKLSDFRFFHISLYIHGKACSDLKPRKIFRIQGEPYFIFLARKDHFWGIPTHKLGYNFSGLAQKLVMFGHERCYLMRGTRL